VGALARGSDQMQLSITPATPTATSIANLAALMSDAVGLTSLFSTGYAADFLAKYLGNVALKSFTASFAPSLSPPVRSVAVQLGTVTPWPLFDGMTLAL